MNRFKSVVLAMAAAFFVVGCGGDTGGLKDGDKMNVMEQLPRVTFDYKFGKDAKHPSEEIGAVRVLEKGAFLEVYKAPAKGGTFVECIPRKYVDEDGNVYETDEALREYFVPEQHRTRDDFLYYSLRINLADIESGKVKLEQ